MASVETSRVALIRYSAPDGTQYVGSGLLINDHAVLTADHVADGSGHQVDCLERTHEVAYVLRSGSSDVDLAILSLKEPIRDLISLRCARIEQRGSARSRIAWPSASLAGNGTATGGGSAQIDGTIPAGEGLEATARNGLRLGFLTLVGNRRPSTPIRVRFDHRYGYNYGLGRHVRSCGDG